MRLRVYNPRQITDEKNEEMLAWQKATGESKKHMLWHFGYDTTDYFEWLSAAFGAYWRRQNGETKGTAEVMGELQRLGRPTDMAEIRKYWAEEQAERDKIREELKRQGRPTDITEIRKYLAEREKAHD